MFGERSHVEAISKNAEFELPDIRICKTCDHYESQGITHYEDDIKYYRITCGNRAICRYIFDQLEALLDEKMDKEFNKIFKEGLDGKLKEEKEGQ